MIKVFISIFVIFSIVQQLAYACDICAIYTAVESGRHKAGALHFGMASQHTSYDELRNHGDKINNPANQYLRSSITQLYVAKDVSEHVALQFNLPIIDRSYRRVEDNVKAHGHESGIGDAVFIGRWRPLDLHDFDSAWHLELLAGVKVPTGNSSRLEEESAEIHHSDDETQVEGDTHDAGSASQHLQIGQSLDRLTVKPKHTGEVHGEEPGLESAVHGHDLALGSGSIDFPLGISVLGQYGRALVSASLQYMLRTEGKHDYRYANDLSWEAGIGGFIIAKDEYSLAAKVNLSGDYKPEDELEGEKLSDTYTRTLFLGPAFSLSTSDNMSVQAAWDFPLDIETKAVQVAQTARVRLALTYRF